jgi:hypothetical protein
MALGWCPPWKWRYTIEHEAAIAWELARRRRRAAAEVVQRVARGWLARNACRVHRWSLDYLGPLSYYVHTGQLELARQLGWAPPEEHDAAERLQIAWRSRGLRRGLQLHLHLEAQATWFVHLVRSARLAEAIALGWKVPPGVDRAARVIQRAWHRFRRALARRTCMFSFVYRPPPGSQSSRTLRQSLSGDGEWAILDREVLLSPTGEAVGFWTPGTLDARWPSADASSTVGLQTPATADRSTAAS